MTSSRGTKVPEKLISKKADEQTAEIEGEEENPPQQAVLDNLFAKLDQLTHLLTEEQPGEAVSVTAPQFRDKLKKGLLNIFLETELEELNQPQNTERVKFTRELFTDVRRTLEARVSYGEEPTSPSYTYPPFDTDLDDFETEPENEQPESAEPVFEESEIELQPQTQDREAVIDKLVSILLDNQELLGTGTGAVGPVTGKTKKLLPQTGQTSEILQVLSAAFYQATREALALNTFKAMDDSPWPTARLSKGGANGHAQLVPPVIENEPLLPPKETERWVQVMWKQREELSDLDADALDLLCHFWLEQAKRPEDAAVAHIDEFLEMRGLKKNQSGSGRRGGYKQEQRLEMLRALSHIQSIWLKMGQIEIYEESDKTGSGRANSTMRKSQGRKRQPVTKQIESRAFVVTDRLGQLNMDGYMEVEQFKYRPGDLFAHFLLGPGRQTAIMSAKAVQYDPYRQKWEKRLARYLSWQWRIQASRTGYSRPYRVNTLLEVVGEENGPQRPHLIRNRLEKALDCLQEDKLIASWQYERWDEEMGGRPGWIQNWREATLLIEPPASIAESYRSLERHQETATNRRLPQAERAENIIQQLKDKRKKLGISQRDCAVELGCGQGFLSKLESGVAKPSEQLLERIKEWLVSK
ncbi:MAG: helix-turn-helix transcriptional regulator [Chloroflexi bacterium]|nr:helix-turn-helix transcriptional regulator [Chloroflexota bacterium]OJV88418.1 MAG: hypothetical protein BGO39_18210 [Chloroflexi bacterium 54-19]